MIRVSKSVLFSAAAVLLLLFALNLWLQRNVALEYSQTSFGVRQIGYKAAFDLLQELHFPVGRFYFLPDRIGENRTLWFVLPDFLKSSRMGDSTDDVDLMQWVRAGGTAVVMGDANSDWSRLNLDLKLANGGDSSTIQGAFSAAPLQIPISGLAYFDQPAGDMEVKLKSDNHPFALDVKSGKGHVIAVADGRFMLNSNLDQGDSSVLVVDLARAVGPPLFDEHCRGLAAPVSTLALLGSPRLLTVVAFGLIAALLWIGEQRSLPPRVLKAADDAPAPSIAAFVESLGVLYSRAQDPSAAFRAYRASFLRRMRRQISPRLELSEPAVIDRITRNRTLADDARAWLTGARIPVSEPELVRAVRALESCPRPSNERRPFKS
jgi:hypothetical protein